MSGKQRLQTRAWALKAERRGSSLAVWPWPVGALSAHKTTEGTERTHPKYLALHPAQTGGSRTPQLNERVMECWPVNFPRSGPRRSSPLRQQEREVWRQLLCFLHQQRGNLLPSLLLPPSIHPDFRRVPHSPLDRQELYDYPHCAGEETEAPRG